MSHGSIRLFVGGFEVAMEHGIWKCRRERKKQCRQNLYYIGMVFEAARVVVK